MNIFAANPALFKGRRIVRIGRSVPGSDLTPEQMRQALAIPQDTPLWLTIHQLIDDLRAQYIDAIADPATAGNTGKMDRMSASYAALDALQTWLITERESVLKEGGQ